MKCVKDNGIHTLYLLPTLLFPYRSVWGRAQWEVARVGSRRSTLLLCTWEAERGSRHRIRSTASGVRRIWVNGQWNGLAEACIILTWNLSTAITLLS